MGGHSKSFNSSTTTSSSSSERFFNNASPNYKKDKKGTYYINNSKPKSPVVSLAISSTTTLVTSNPMNIQQTPPNKRNRSPTVNSPAGGSCSPPNFAYYAGSKCFDSPSPASLPKPPSHWVSRGAKKSLMMHKSCAAEFATSSTNDMISHNLKMLLNVQA